MNKLAGIFLVIAALAIPEFLMAGEPTKDTLITAWESAQKSNSANSEFSKVSEGLYKLKNSQIPFEGEIKFTNVLVDDSLKDIGEGSVMGSIEVEFVGVPKDFNEKNWRGVNL